MCEQRGAVSERGNFTIALLLFHAFGDDIYSLLGDRFSILFTINMLNVSNIQHFSFWLTAIRLTSVFSRQMGNYGCYFLLGLDLQINNVHVSILDA